MIPPPLSGRHTFASIRNHFVAGCRKGPRETGDQALKGRATRRDPMSLRNVTRNLAVGIATGAVLIAAQSVQAADERGSVQGVVTNASGQPVTGAYVKVKNAERRLTFM